MDMSDLPPDLNEASVCDPTPIDMPFTTPHEVQYKIVSNTLIRGRDKLFDSFGYSYTVKKGTVFQLHGVTQSATKACSALLQCMSLAVNVHKV